MFTSWFRLRERCPRCGYSFQREEGFWVGAIIVNTGGAQVGFFALLLGGMLVFWPDVPWTALLVAGLSFMALFPVAFYPYSKLLWMWFDLVLHPPGD